MQEEHARGVEEGLPQQKIPVARHEVAELAATGIGGKRRAYLLMMRIRIIVADPRLKKVSQYVQTLCRERFVLQESQKAGRCRRSRRVQMQVGYKEYRHTNSD